ncbi:MAG: 4-hydroxy-2-oxo-heptane-1,7-dioate aldolase [Verrucomicrobia bacterium]|nr:4-hydroxy-2-oxo-heptane-1,7-dioate aldolase [Verrucomicrobiota bacterium]
MDLFASIATFRQKMRSGQVCLGVGITLGDPAVTEALGPCADFFWIDLEHTPLGLGSLQAHLIAARAVNVPALVRVPGSDPSLIKRVIDTGAAGIIVPQVRSAAEVRRVVDACRYRPLGDRGYGPRRSSDYGHAVDYLQTANRDLFVSVQIEHAEAMAELDQIASVAGLDSLVLGPFDLSISLGCPGDVTHPDVQHAIQRVIRTAKARGLFVGMGGPAQEKYARQAIAAGVQWLQSGSDFEYMIEFTRRFFSTVRSNAPRQTP